MINKVLLGIVLVALGMGIWLSIRHDLISLGETKVTNRVIFKTQEETVKTHEKIREVRSHRPSEQRTIDRLRSGSY